MTLDADICYQALRARDRRFDGLFFVGVETTGVYCRPICPARSPGRQRCRFFERAAEAERAGFRACFRCRPELAPGRAAVDAVAELVRIAAFRIDEGYLNEHSIEDLASTLGVSARHLRRATRAELGVSIVELAQTKRLALAKQLLQDTRMSLADVAFASGFGSVRRFNVLFKRRFGRPPSSIRREHGSRSAGESISLRLDYRPPLDWAGLLSFFRGRAVGGVEHVDAETYRRTVSLGNAVGWIAVRHDEARPALRAEVSYSLAPKLMTIATRLRAMFDLDARPDVIAAHLGRDSRLRRLLSRQPGLRVPGAFDPFETAIRAVLGQQVSVAAANTLCGRLTERLGSVPADVALPGARLFPTAQALAEVPSSEIRSLGLPRTRAETIAALAEAVAGGDLDLRAETDPATLMAALEQIRGIGPWTAQYIAMRVLRWPDAFPAGDLALQKALGVKTAAEARRLAQPWRPWRAYAVIHLWNTLSSGG